MTTPTGQIALSDVNVELGKSSTALITKNDTDVRTLANRPVPGSQISMDDLRGKTWDISRPTVTITRSGSGTVIQGQTITITFSISEPVTGFTSTDVVVTNGSISGFSGSGASYTATFTPTNNITANATISVAENSFLDANNNGNLSGSLTIPVDTIKPSISISRSGSGTIGTNQTATITFITSESTSNFISSDVSVSGGSISGFSGSGTNYSATFTPSASFTGTATVSVNADSFTDSAGNGNTFGSLSISVDTQAPSVTITRSGSGILISGQTAAITFTLSESTTNFTSADVTATNGTISGFSGSGTVYTATFTPQAEFSGTGTISVAAGSFTDSIGNGNTAGSLSIPIETGSVSMSISTNASQPITTSVTINFVSNKFTSNFTSGDISVFPGSFSNFSGSGVVYSITYNPPSNSSGSATISVPAGAYTDGAGNPNLAASLTISYNTVPADTTRPSITVSRFEQDASSGPETIDFVTSESTTNFTLGDITISGGTLSDFSGSGTVYSATYTPPLNSSGTTNISVPQNVFTDAAGNGNFASNTLSFNYAYFIDTTRPTISITRSGSGTSTASETITFTTSENTTNFSIGDVTTTGGTLSGFSGSGSFYTATYTPTSNSSGTATISVAQNAFTDAAGNGNFSGSLQFNFNTVADTTPPSMTITRSGSGTSTSAETITFTSSESTSNFTSADVTISGGSITNFSGSGTSYTATYTPPSNSSGTTTISVGQGAFTDAAGNGNTSASLQFSYNTVVGGTVTIVNPPGYNNGSRTSTDFSFGYAQVTLNYFSNGTYEFYDNGGEGGYQISSGNWATPTTAGVGSNYWVRFTRTSVSVGQYGDASTSTGWLNLGSTQQVYVSMSTPDDGVTRTASATYTVEVSSNSSGTNILSSGSVTMYAQARLDGFN